MLHRDLRRVLAGHAVVLDEPCLLEPLQEFLVLGLFLYLVRHFQPLIASRMSTKIAVMPIMLYHHKEGTPHLVKGCRKNKLYNAQSKAAIANRMWKSDLTGKII